MRKTRWNTTSDAGRALPPSCKIIVLIHGAGEGSIRERVVDGTEALALGYDTDYLEKCAWNDTFTSRRADSPTRRHGVVRAAVRYILDEVHRCTVHTAEFLVENEGGVIVPDRAAPISVKGAMGDMVRNVATVIRHQRARSPSDFAKAIIECSAIDMPMLSGSRPHGTQAPRGPR